MINGITFAVASDPTSKTNATAKAALMVLTDEKFQRYLLEMIPAIARARRWKVDTSLELAKLTIQQVKQEMEDSTKEVIGVRPGPNPPTPTQYETGILNEKDEDVVRLYIEVMKMNKDDYHFPSFYHRNLPI